MTDASVQWQCDPSKIEISFSKTQHFPMKQKHLRLVHFSYLRKASTEKYSGRHSGGKTTIPTSGWMWFPKDTVL